MFLASVALSPIVVAALTAMALAVPRLGAAQAPAPPPTDNPSRLQTPEALQVEHRDIRQALMLATHAAGSLGATAPELAALLEPRFEREDTIALPPLGQLVPLARGEFTLGMRAVIPLTDSLGAELPRMLRGHAAILAATLRLQEAAQAAGAATVARLVEAQALHARHEEEVLYPAGLLVGEVVRVRSQRLGQ